MTQATFYDGVTADRRSVEIGIEGEGALLVRLANGAPLVVPAAELAIVEDDQRHLVLSRKDHPGWRLLIDPPVDPAIRALLPRAARYGAWIDRVGLPKATALLGVVAAIILFVGYSAPAWVAPLVPEQWEQNLGTALVGDFGDNACRDPASTTALAAMARRIDPLAGGRGPIPMTLIDVRIFNAAAIPGNQIIIFDGALRDTPNPDAMAGILAHEIAHVRRRHVTQALIRELGIGALIRLFAGDVGANAQQIVSLSYTRSNEAEADADAITALDRASIDPRPTASLFRKLGKQAGGFDSVEWLNSHPRSADRAKAFDAAFDKSRAYTPSISAADYRAIRIACPAKRNAERRARIADRR
ncbi:MAG: M48 family metallopeptidase [Sphingomonas sp.]|uniref:M48 family metallopeptidase n=1 Tax=Sphingomonas sp. TaxID=28214 RepID=UPI00179B55BA|nr:M48 family metallopeptidase [Sphingomonas sp.]MBA3668265.1 M48 family metallopeptidase [Sphingomonas sp.]